MIGGCRNQCQAAAKTTDPTTTTTIQPSGPGSCSAPFGLLKKTMPFRPFAFNL